CPLVVGTLTGWLFAPRRWAASCGALGLLAATALFQWHQHRLDTRITVLPLGGGDSIHVDAPGRTDDLLIDCGNESAAQFVVKPFLAAQGVNRLPRLLLTHGDLRHIGGAANFVETFAAQTVLISSARFRSSAYARTIETLGSPRERLR